MNKNNIVGYFFQIACNVGGEQNGVFFLLDKS